MRYVVEVETASYVWTRLGPQDSVALDKGCVVIKLRNGQGRRNVTSGSLKSLQTDVRTMLGVLLPMLYVLRV